MSKDFYYATFAADREERKLTAKNPVKPITAAAHSKPIVSLSHPPIIGPRNRLQEKRITLVRWLYTNTKTDERTRFP